MQKLLFFIVLNFLIQLSYSQSPVFQWAKSFGGASQDFGSSIAVDASGNVCSSGFFHDSADFDPGPGTYNLYSAGSREIFISKLDSNGDFLWAKQMGSSQADEAKSITVDALGNVYTTGYFQDTVDFDPGPGIYNLISASSYDVFVLKLAPNGNFIWAKNMGTTSGEEGNDIIVDGSGNVYTIGQFALISDFNPGPGTYNLTADSLWFYDIFISKLDSSGNFVWAKRLGGTTEDIAYSIALDGSGNIYSTGYFTGKADFDPGPGIYYLYAAGGRDIFVSKLDSFGNFVWAKNMGEATGGPNELGSDILTDPMGNVYTTGWFWGIADFDPGPGVYNLNGFSSLDIFISKLDAFGNFVWAKNIGSGGHDYGNSIAMDAFGNIYTTGLFVNTCDFDPNSGIVDISATSFGGNLFISELDSSGNYVWAGAISSSVLSTGRSIALDASGNIYVGGGYYGTSDFDPGAGTYDLTSIGGIQPDIFVQKMSPSTTPVGAAEYTVGEPISIYPNPNNGVFNIIAFESSNNSNVEIYNSIGSLVYSIKIESGLNTIELIEQANGLYFVKVIADDKAIFVQKVIKK